MNCKKEIFAYYDKKYIRVYQAYNKEIAMEAINLKTFGDKYNKNRMTWIKPSFLWMMERSNWGRKKNQECILAIDILREGFDGYLEQAVLTSNESKIFKTSKEWENSFRGTDVYCQWDPDRDLYGNATDRMAIQIGIKNKALQDYLEKNICDIIDISKDVYKWRNQLNNGKLNKKNLPKETIYIVSDKIRKQLNMD